MGGITSLSYLMKVLKRPQLLSHLDFRFLACPFGISTAPGGYQARMDHQILKEFYLNGAVVYIDDTVIYGANLGTFLERLDLVLERMARFNVRLKPRKFFFGMASVEFLGHIFDEKGIVMSSTCIQGSRIYRNLC